MQALPRMLARDAPPVCAASAWRLAAGRRSSWRGAAENHGRALRDAKAACGSAGARAHLYDFEFSDVEGALFDLDAHGLRWRHGHGAQHYAAPRRCLGTERRRTPGQGKHVAGSHGQATVRPVAPPGFAATRCKSSPHAKRRQTGCGACMRHTRAQDRLAPALQAHEVFVAARPSSLSSAHAARLAACLRRPKPRASSTIQSRHDAELQSWSGRLQRTRRPYIMLNKQCQQAWSSGEPICALTDRRAGTDCDCLKQFRRFCGVALSFRV